MGHIFFWKGKNLIEHESSFKKKMLSDIYSLKHNSGSFLLGHSSQIARLSMTNSNEYFFSVGEYDRTMLEWKSNLFSFRLQ